MGPDEEAACGDVNNIPCPAGRDSDHSRHHYHRDGRAWAGGTVRDGGAEGSVAVPVR
ncbi:MAG: hypothetical protein NTV68_01695 [Methanomicrobiales archaeon]|nr:hypothetical protein [Methanomicrobiales archaeon]